MSQQMPVVREIYYSGLVPQFAAIVVLSAGVHLIFPSVSALMVLIIASLLYLIYCRLSRWIFTRDHIRGIQLYRAGKFQEAISHFDASHRFFAAHRTMDAWRSLIFGAASRNSYRLMALGNMAFCHGQLGEHAKAIELYERILQESPDHALAKAMLSMLRASSQPNPAA